MALALFYDALILYGPYDVSGDHNEIRLDQKQDVREKTVFGNDTHVFAPGLRAFDVSGRGLVQFDDTTTPKAVDYNLFNEIAGASKQFTIAASKADGAVAYLGKSQADTYEFNLKNDQLGTFDFTLASAGKNARGQLILPLTARSAATGNGTITQLGALSSTQKLLATLHMTSITATNVVVTIKSNTTQTTVGATTRGTFTTATGVTSELIEIAGPITDTWWYAEWSRTGGSTFTAAVAAGVR